MNGGNGCYLSVQFLFLGGGSIDCYTLSSSTQMINVMSMDGLEKTNQISSHKLAPLPKPKRAGGHSRRYWLDSGPHAFVHLLPPPHLEGSQ